MRIEEVIETLNLKILNRGKSFNVREGFVCDLLSVVLAKGVKNSIWITVQRHINIVAVALLKGIGAIIITHGFNPYEDVIKRAESEGIWILKTEDSSFEICGRLYSLLKERKEVLK